MAIYLGQIRYNPGKEHFKMKLNIGSADTEIAGFTPVDRCFGQEAYPLEYEDGSVEEIRASHILEHFGWADVKDVLKDWVRVLRPGGLIRLAVPDISKCVESGDPKWKHFIMGGQTDENDFHKSVWDASSLRALMDACGLEHIERWESDNTDCASLPISLNLQGRKPVVIPRITVQMTLPRYGANVAMHSIYTSLHENGLWVYPSFGAYWHECMERDFDAAVEFGAEWILTLDSDSMVRPRDIAMIIQAKDKNDMDAICAKQAKRHSKEPLSAHFGLCLLSVSALESVPKPWFWAQPDDAGGWDKGRSEADREFWRKWRAAGNTVGQLPVCSIGHLEESVRVVDDSNRIKLVDMQAWLSQ
jgi:predicted SAM-dependent methyltransferase